MLKKYVIERTLKGVGGSSQEQYRKMTGTSNETLSNLGPDIQWRESYVTDDKIYCVYLAKNEELIREHAKISGFPVDKISEIRTTLDPSSDVEQQRSYTQAAAPQSEARPH
jgi:hypothetical protein